VVVISLAQRGDDDAEKRRYSAMVLRIKFKKNAGTSST